MDLGQVDLKLGTSSKDGVTRRVIVGRPIMTRRVLLLAKGPKSAGLLQKNSQVNPRTVIASLGNFAGIRSTTLKVFFQHYILKFGSQDDANKFFYYLNPERMRKRMLWGS